MQIVPLQALPNQQISVVLANQRCTINVYQETTGLFLDLLVNDVAIVVGVVCENLNRIVRSIYLGFIGDLCFIDNQGSDDPDYTQLGTRFDLAYLDATEAAAAQEAAQP